MSYGRVLGIWLAVATLALPVFAGGVFIGSAIFHDSSIVSHSPSYLEGASSNVLTVTVCRDTSFPERPFLNALSTWNCLTPFIPNIDASGGVPPQNENEWDVESVLLHEIGHCLGFGHTSIDGQTSHFFTNSRAGSNGGFDLDFGSDLVWGSRDDNRVDDKNLHWFRIDSNNPFLAAGTIDSRTYSISIGDLPDGHLFSESLTRELSDLRGFPITSAVMRTRHGKEEEGRRLSPSEFAIYRLGGSGIDFEEGTQDDYVVSLEYAPHLGIDSPECDFIVEYADLNGAIAQCGNGSGQMLMAEDLVQISGNHYRMPSPLRVQLDDSVAWWTDDGALPQCNPTDLAISIDGDAVAEGQPVLFTVRVDNLGTARSATARVLVDSPLEIVDIEGRQSCVFDASLRAWSCLVGDLPAGMAKEWNFTAASQSVGNYPVVADVHTPPAPSELDPSDNTAALEIEVRPGADLSVSLTDLTDPVQVGDSVTYLAHISNAGSENATNISLVYAVPNELAYVDDPADNCTESASLVTCSLGTIPVGQSTIALLETIATQGGVVESAVLVSAAEPDPDIVEGASQTTTLADFTLPYEIKLLGSDSAEGELFGIAVAVHEDLVAVGSHLHDDGKGAVYVYRRIGIDWVEKQKLTASDGFIDDRFGVSVALDSETLVVGSFLDDDGGDGAGAVYVFGFDGQSWLEQQKLVASDTSEGDHFGGWVDIDGATIVAGARLNDERGDDAGKVYIFKLESGIWTERQKLTPIDVDDGDEFGHRFSVQGDYLTVCARLDDDAGEDAGAVYFFEEIDNQFVETQKSIGSHTSAGDEFCYSVGIDQGKAVVGARLDDIAELSAGAGYLFEVDDSGHWIEVATLIAGDAEDGDQLGRAAAISSEITVVGAAEAFNGGTRSGAAYSFKRSELWSPFKKLSPSVASSHDRFGGSLSISDSTIVIGAYSDDTLGNASGAAYVYELFSSDQPNIVFTYPARSKSFLLGEHIVLEWISLNTDLTDLIFLGMRRDSAPTSEAEVVLLAMTDNDGEESIFIPDSIDIADDWRFFVRHLDSGAFDSSNTAFSVVLDPATIIFIDGFESGDFSAWSSSLP